MRLKILGSDVVMVIYEVPFRFLDLETCGSQILAKHNEVNTTGDKIIYMYVCR